MECCENDPTIWKCIEISKVNHVTVKNAEREVSVYNVLRGYFYIGNDADNFLMNNNIGYQR